MLIGRGLAGKEDMPDFELNWLNIQPLRMKTTKESSGNYFLNEYNNLINYLSYTNANIFGKAYEFLRLRLCEKSLIFASLLEKDPIK